MRDNLVLCVSHIHRWREVSLDLNGSVQDALFNLNRDSFGTFGVFLHIWNICLERVPRWTTLQAPSFLRRATWGR